MSKNKKILAIILFAGLILRLSFLLLNYKNSRDYLGGESVKYFGHTVHAADMAVAYVMHNKIGVYDEHYRHKYHMAVNKAGRPVDPEDVNFGESSDENIKVDYMNSIGLGTIMGMLWKITGDMRFIYFQILQLMIDVLCILLVYLITLNIFNISGLALTAGLIYSLFPFQIYLITYPSPYPWTVFGAIGVLYFISKIYGNKGEAVDEKGKIISFILAGMTIGLFTYIRSTMFYLPVFIILALMLKEDLIKTLKYGFLIILSAFIVLLPLLIRNYKVFDKFMLTRGVFWHSIWTGFGGHENPWGIVYNDGAVAASVMADNPDIERFGPEYEEILKKRTINGIREHPFWLVKVFGERVLRLFFPVSWRGEGVPYLSMKKTLMVFPINIMTLIGVYMIVRRRLLDGNTLLFYFTISTFYYFVTIIMVHTPQIKYIYPGYVFMLIVSSIPIWEGYKTVKRKVSN